MKVQSWAKFYLLFSAAGLFPIALSYGVAPAGVLPAVLDVAVEGTDLTHIFRAVMGLYLAMIVLWILGAFRPELTRAALISDECSASSPMESRACFSSPTRLWRS
jgi:hypothetical protein